jgi:hypothetical protein
MSGKVANYSGALQKGQWVELIAVPAHRPELQKLIGRHGAIIDKVLSSPPNCCLWYYIEIGDYPKFFATRDMIEAWKP